ATDRADLALPFEFHLQFGLEHRFELLVGQKGGGAGAKSATGHSTGRTTIVAAECGAATGEDRLVRGQECLALPRARRVEGGPLIARPFRNVIETEHFGHFLLELALELRLQFAETFELAKRDGHCDLSLWVGRRTLEAESTANCRKAPPRMPHRT